VRGELDWIVMKALEKDRNRRYETASGLAADLRRYLDDEPVLACPPSAGYRLRKFARRNKAILTMASLAALALLGIGAAGLFAHRNRLAEEQRRTAQKAHEEQLLSVKWQNSLEKALMAAMSGDLSGAEKGIDEAELLGASTGQVRMLRGQVALHQGDVNSAIRHLEQAVQLVPHSVAAHAMLTMAYYHNGQTLRMQEMKQELKTLTPNSAEDFLFKGQVETLTLPADAARMQSLDEAVRRRDSVIARVVRAKARADRALFFTDPRDAEAALEDAHIARGMLPDNPFVLSQSVYANLVAGVIYEHLARQGDAKRAVEQARRDVENLGRFSLPIARQSCFWYFEYVGSEQQAYEMSRQGTELRLVPVLYRRGDLKQALEAAERAVVHGYPLGRVERGFILAELPDGPARARATFQEAMNLPDDSRFYRMDAPLLLFLLGKKEEATHASLKVNDKEAQSPFGNDSWYHKCRDYNCGLVSADELLKAAEISRLMQCEAHFLIALHDLADRDRAGARAHFWKCADTRAFIYWDWIWARAFLKRMDEDPTWPPWIPLKR
jgi:tetratricopeptide (TPR) repeat protein